MTDISSDIIMVSAGAIAGAVSSFFANRAKNKAIAERTVGEAWDKYSENLEKRIAVLDGQVNEHTQLIAKQNQTIAEQNNTIATQNNRIAEQDRIIREQREIIDDLTKQVISLGAVPVHKRKN